MDACRPVQYNDFACAAELFLWTVIIGMGGRIESERVDDLIGIRTIETEVYIPSDHWGYTAGFSNLSAHGQNDGKDVIWFGIRKPYKGQIDFGWRNDATGENRTTVLNLGDIEELKNLSDLRDKWIKFRIEIDNSNKRIRFLVNGRILGEVNDVVFNVRDWHDGLLPSVSKLEDLWVNRGDFIYNRNSAHEISK